MNANEAEELLDVYLADTLRCDCDECVKLRSTIVKAMTRPTDAEAEAAIEDLEQAKFDVAVSETSQPFASASKRERDELKAARDRVFKLITGKTE